MTRYKNRWTNRVTEDPVLVAIHFLLEFKEPKDTEVNRYERIYKNIAFMHQLDLMGADRETMTASLLYNVKGQWLGRLKFEIFGGEISQLQGKFDRVLQNREQWQEKSADSDMNIQNYRINQMLQAYDIVFQQDEEGKYSPILLHVPHSSTFIPRFELMEYHREPQHEHAIMTDWFCDALFACHHEMLTSPVSRLYCDMERFRDDDLEEMAKVGMGAVYTHCSDGSLLRSVMDYEKENILQKYYDVHHQKLTDMVEKRLQDFGKCLIIDGHSFHAEPLPHEPDQTVPRPDICIGTDAYHTPDWLTEAAVAYWENLGYTVAVNSPFAGTMVPLKHYGKDKRVMSIMLELNRNLYCHMPMPGLVVPNRHYDKIKQQVKEWIAKMEAMLFGEKDADDREKEKYE